MTDTKKTAAKPTKADAKEPSAPGVVLVTMRKGGDTIDVDPSCIAAHHTAGWRED